MDGTRFDTLIKGLSTTHVTRGSAIRGVLGGAVAALAAVTVTGGTDARGVTARLTPNKNKHKNKNNTKNLPDRKKRKTTICHCADRFAAGCTTIKIRITSAKKHQKHPCDYAGPCTGVSGCPTLGL